MLSGGLWPAYYRLNAFSIERRVLSNLIRSLNILKHDSLQLIDLLGSDTHESSVEHGPKLSENLTNIRKTLPFILRFRIAVVAILAVNRLNQLGMSSCKFFIAEDLPWEIQACTCVCSGGFQRSKRIFRGKSIKDL